MGRTVRLMTALLYTPIYKLAINFGTFTINNWMKSVKDAFCQNFSAIAVSVLLLFLLDLGQLKTVC